jgi:hypothetical protein
MPGVQTPEHPLSVHNVVQMDVAFQLPAALQVDNMFVSHFICPGLQMPVHAPLVQR